MTTNDTQTPESTQSVEDDRELVTMAEAKRMVDSLRGDLLFVYQPEYLSPMAEEHYALALDLMAQAVKQIQLADYCRMRQF